MVEVVFLVVQLTYGEMLALLPTMIANLQRKLYQLAWRFLCLLHESNA